MKHKTSLFLPFLKVVLICLLLESAWSAPKVETAETKVFQESGQLVGLDELFKTAAGSGTEASRKTTSLGVVLVTPDGVFSFLETPENEKHLERVPAGSFVELSGELLVSGRLLQIGSLEVLAEGPRPNIDLKDLRNDGGRPVKLVGKNLCQCGLEVGSLAHSCQLGHLHHLQTPEGKIYHYLPSDAGSALFLGGSNHFSTVEVTGQEFPGHYLLVNSSRRLQ